MSRNHCKLVVLKFTPRTGRAQDRDTAGAERGGQSRLAPHVDGDLKGKLQNRMWHKQDSQGQIPALASRPGTSGEVPRGEKMLYSGNDPESYITEFTFVYSVV